MRDTNCQVTFFVCIFFQKAVYFEIEWPKQVKSFTEVTL